MNLDVGQFALVVSWAATGTGLALWVWSFLERHPLRKLRMSDCGTVLIFSSILLRIVGQERVLSTIDWALAFLSPLFIAAALWRLARTTCPPGAGD